VGFEGVGGGEEEKEKPVIVLSSRVRCWSRISLARTRAKCRAPMLLSALRATSIFVRPGACVCVCACVGVCLFDCLCVFVCT